MSKVRRFSILLLVLGSFLSVISGAEDQASQHGPRIVMSSQIRGTINPATVDYLKLAIQKATDKHAQALIVELDTPGGLVASVESMSQAIDESKIPVVVYVTPAGAAATSAGALLMLSSHIGAMTPGSHMGAAHPVDSSGSDVKGAMGEKVLNDTVSYAKGMAEIRGRNKELAELIVSKSQSFTAQEAFSKNLIEVLADHEVDLLRKLNGRVVESKNFGKRTLQTENAQVERVDMTLGQRFLHLISNPNIASILMTLAMLLIYVELNHPGIQIAGILGVILLILAFMSFQTLPIRTGGIILMGVGFVGMFSEVFTNAHGALATGGVLSFVLGMIYVVDPSQSSQGVSPYVWVPAGSALAIGAFTLAWFAARVKEQAQAALKMIGGTGVMGLMGYEGKVESLAGDGAMASPFGKLTIRGEVWDFVCEDSVRVGDLVQVESVNGFKLKVKRL